ncbi:uncharacterized protein [Aristolochia californica]|uniref:uncharacterized protein n=1 Tax=Aristolochia californica TaxID=171875 RepID=UPI0035D5B8E5
MPPPSQQHSRINLADLKAQIVKKLGPDRANRYFTYLNRLLSQKLGKGDFDKWCYLTLGRENLHLHNQLIRSILKNACHGTVPPPLPQKVVPPSIGKREEGHAQSGSAAATIWSNGDVLPMSPRKLRTGFRDRRVKDRPSPLGPNGKTDLTAHQSIGTDEAVGKVGYENGEANLCDMERSMQHHQGLAEQPETERDALLRPLKRPRVKQALANGPVLVHNVAPPNLLIIEDGEEVEQAHDSNFSRSRSPLRAPLGIPFCPASVGGARRTLPMASSSSFYSSVDSNELSDTETLRKRMEQIAGTEGLDKVSLDCANLLNNGLDTYLKQLIRSCVELVGARSGLELIKHSVYKQLPPGKIINGAWPGNHMHMQSSSAPMEGIQDYRNSCPISLLDFKVAMELNPQQLGEDWPLLLEKICLHSCEE